MPTMYGSIDDVEARVSTDPVRQNGKAMLQIELAMGVYGEDSRAVIQQWLAEDDKREAEKLRLQRDEWEQSIKLRTTVAAETQAAQAVKATRISLAALAVAALSLLVACVALIRGG